MPAEKRDAPFVLAEHQRGTQRLAAVNIAAEACGLHTGMTLADARALVPDTHIEMLDPARGRPRSINALAGCVAIPHGSVLTRTRQPRLVARHKWLRTFVWRRTPHARRHAGAVQPSRYHLLYRRG